VKRLVNASEAEIASVLGISMEMARRIKKYLS